PSHVSTQLPLHHRLVQYNMPACSSWAAGWRTSGLPAVSRDAPRLEREEAGAAMLAQRCRRSTNYNDRDEVGINQLLRGVCSLGMIWHLAFVRSVFCSRDFSTG